MASSNSFRDYPEEKTRLARQACLHLATYLVDFLDDLVLVGGLVPSLLIPKLRFPGQQPHLGTLDVDLGLSVGIRDSRHYDQVVDRLRNAGFAQDRNQDGRLTRQRWRFSGDLPATVDFLFPETAATPPPGKLQDLSSDLAAIVTRGLDLAFLDPRPLRLKELTLRGVRAERTIHVCAPAPFLVLKALAFGNRGFEKDAYDLAYMVLYGPDRTDEISGFLAHHEDHPAIRDAIAILQRDFADSDNLGPARAAAFLDRAGDLEFRADIAGAIRAVLKKTA